MRSLRLPTISFLNCWLLSTTARKSRIAKMLSKLRSANGSDAIKLISLSISSLQFLNSALR